MLTATYMCMPIIVDNNRVDTPCMQVTVNTRLYEYGHEQVRIRKKEMK